MPRTIRVPVKLIYNDGPWLSVAIGGRQSSIQLTQLNFPEARVQALLSWSLYQLAGMDEVEVMVDLIQNNSTWLSINHGPEFAVINLATIDSLAARTTFQLWAVDQIDLARRQTLPERLEDERNLLQRTCEQLRARIEQMHTDWSGN